MPTGGEIEQRVIFRHVAGTLHCSTSRTKMETHERDEAIANLRECLKPGTTIYTVLRSVSASGMSRTLDLYYVANNEILRLTWSTAKALEWTYDRRKEALRINGCGMDMGWNTVYHLSHVILGDGYALNHRWL